MHARAVCVARLNLRACMHACIKLYGTEFDAAKMEHQAGLNGQDLSNYYTWMLERTLETMQHLPEFILTDLRRP